MLLPLPYPAAVTLLDLISAQSSAKEVIIAIQEKAEALRWSTQAEDEVDDPEKDEVSRAGQSARLLRLCSHGMFASFVKYKN